MKFTLSRIQSIRHLGANGARRLLIVVRTPKMAVSGNSVC